VDDRGFKMSQTALMPKKKKAKPVGRNPYRWARIREQLYPIAEEAAGDAAKDFTEWVNEAVREKLEREHRWPPPK